MLQKYLKYNSFPQRSGFQPQSSKFWIVFGKSSDLYHEAHLILYWECIQVLLVSIIYQYVSISLNRQDTATVASFQQLSVLTVAFEYNFLASCHPLLNVSQGLFMCLYNIHTYVYLFFSKKRRNHSIFGAFLVEIILHHVPTSPTSTYVST